MKTHICGQWGIQPGRHWLDMLLNQNKFTEHKTMEFDIHHSCIKSTLDLFFTTNNSLVNNVKVISGISDHEIMYIEASPRPRMLKKKPPRKLYLKFYKKANVENIQNMKLNDLNLLQDQNIEDLLDQFRFKALNIPTKMLNN